MRKFNSKLTPLVALVGMKKRNTMLGAWMFLPLILVSQILYAGEIKAQANDSDTTNIGFIKKPPKELKEKFPMCDDFLKVTWLNKEQMVGYSRYDIIDLTTKKKTRITALVSLGMYPMYDGYLQKYQREGKLDELFSFVRAGKVLRSHGLLNIRNGKKLLVFYSFPDGLSFTGRHGSLCIPYPDGKHMWILLKSVGQSMNSEELEQSYDSFKRSFPDTEIKKFRGFQVFDLRPDAHGYIDYSIDPSRVLLQFHGKYVRLERTYETGIRAYRFPPTSRTCEDALARYSFGGAPEIFTTDGKYYFLNQCNLTKLNEEVK